MPPFKNVMIAVLALALAIVAGLAWQQQRELARLRQLPATTAAVTAPLVNLRGGTSRHIALPPAGLTTNSRDDQRAEMYGPDFGFRSEKQVGRRGGLGGRSLAQLAQNPEFLSALGTYQQGVLDTRFAGLFRKLNLSGPELTAFKRLLVQKESAEFDVVAVGETVAESPLSPEEMRSTVRVVQAQVENEIRNSLGDDRYAVYRDYEATLPQRATVAQLEQRLSYSPTPLTPAQSESMVKILATHAPAKENVVISPTTVVAGAEVVESSSIIHPSSVAAVVSDDAVVSAQGVLSTEQVSALQQIQVEQQSALRASHLIRVAIPGMNEPPLDWKVLMQ